MGEPHIAEGLSLVEIERLAALLASLGLPEERWEQYEADVQGLVEVALDAYFADLREPNIGVPS